MRHFVGISQVVMSEDPDDVLVAPHLGSCLGIAVYDPVTRRGGLIHSLLPTGKADPEKAETTPYMYVDTGLSCLLETFLASGAHKRDLCITAAGGAEMDAAGGALEIGKRNYVILKKLLWKNGLLLRGEDVGETISRTLLLEIGTGKTWVKSARGCREL